MQTPPAAPSATAWIDGLSQLSDPVLLAVVQAGVARLQATTFAGGAMPDEDLRDSVRALQRVENSVHAEKLRRLVEVDTRKAYQAEAERSAADWFAAATGVSGVEARRQVRTAEALSRLPQTQQRLADGAITAGHADTAARGLAELERLAADRRQAAGDDMDAWEAADAHASAIAAAFDGMVADTAPIVDRAELGRRIDAWTRNHAAEVIDDREARALRHRGIHLASRRNRNGLWSNRVDLTDAAQAQFLAAIQPLARKTSRDDDRSRPQRLHDALATACAKLCDAGDLPTVAAQRPHVTVIRDRDDSVTIDGLGPVSSNTARLFECDADTTVIVRNTDGTTWDVGRVNGDPTRIQRRIVTARDKACIGCGAPAWRCHLHHIKFRSSGGKTVVSNLVLVCWACHSGIHHLGWTVEGNPTSGFWINKHPAAATAGAGPPGNPPPRHSP